MKTVVLIIPFENIYPPVSGGMLRCFHLWRQLCRNFRVVAITFQPADTFQEALSRFPELKNSEILTAEPLRPAAHGLAGSIARARNALRYRWLTRSPKASANSNFLRIFPLLRKQLQEIKVDAVIFEEMSVLSLSGWVRRHHRSIRVFYDAHNVNLHLAKIDFEQHRISAVQLSEAEKAEKNIWRWTPDIFACSETDLDAMAALNGHKLRGIVVPNGVELKIPGADPDRQETGTEKILFCGSLDYPPNQEGLGWFCREVFPVILGDRPQTELHVVGRGDPGTALTGLLRHPRITNHGFVADLGPFYAGAQLAVVPLMSGSGTRLKLLEAMSYGVPVVSTTTGAEGIGYTNEKNIFIADDSAAFARRVLLLLNDRRTAGQIAEAALDLVRRRYDWDRIGETMNRYLEEQIGS